MAPLQTKNLSLAFDQNKHTWTLSSVSDRTISISSKLPVFHGLDSLSKSIECPVTFSHLNQEEIMLPRLGQAILVSFDQAFNPHIKAKVEFAMLNEIPLCLIRLRIQNIHGNTIKQTRFDLLRSTEIHFLGNSDSIDLGSYVNGWQSWSHSGTYGSEHKQVVSKLGTFQGPKLYDAATPTISKSGNFASDMFGAIVDRTTRNGIIAGFLSQNNHFGHIFMELKPDLLLSAHAAGDQAEILPDSEVTTDWLAVGFFAIDQPDPFAHYLDAAAAANKVKIPNDVPSGWCSWYQYFTQITPYTIITNLDQLVERKEELPVQFIQIDDGYQRAVGDWLNLKPIFEDKMATLSTEISEAGYTPGLWIAPFIVHPKSRLYQEQPQYLIKIGQRKNASAGWNWNNFCAGLDMTHPEARDYIKKVIFTAVHDWGYPYLKLDFLYAGAIAGNYTDRTKTRAQILRQAMMDIREAAGPNSYLLGCGAPVGSMLGIVDGMRIGTDVAPDWEPKYMGIELLFPNEPDIPSAKNALQNTLTRAFMHNRWWHNDPDCLLVRESSNLTLAEVQTLASIIAMSGGLMLLSDDMNKVSRFRLRIAQSMLPLLPDRPWVVDWADQLTPAKVRQDIHNGGGDYHLLSFTNWSNNQIHNCIDLSSYFLSSDTRWIARSYWDEEITLIDDGKYNIDLPAHGTVLIALKPFDPQKPLYLGGDMHISQGIELSKWSERKDGVDFQLSLPRKTEGVVDLYLPRPARAFSDEGDIPLTGIKEKCFRLQVSIKGNLDIHIRYL